MKYTFELLGISSVLDFFNHQQKKSAVGVEYLGTNQCTLDAFIKSIENVPHKRSWEIDKVVDTVIQFWVNHSEHIHYWQTRLKDAGQDNILVARVADLRSLRIEFEHLLSKNT
ncbi:MAG: hypothetical protein F6K36_16525 [Symploca sp. SIO3C6]|uniref:Uncharacterized protein n=1 Tax=Symploca sp. SIO1C4 TaxID=2607765 RepID=A0A6B3NRT7_9CYAN|nr:hypothetical protein [Symploca sp. SIO3C6]NER32201.1 hypothetical protein [Symploca sp. SIO1C4]NET06654.1 hypothetical protein [Symploca sp. SIO2B6]